MVPKRRLIIVFVASSTTFGCVPAQTTMPVEGQLLVNGSFEDGPPTQDYTALDPESKAIPGWIVIHGQIDYTRGYWIDADGQASIDLQGSPGTGGVKQTFSTQPGARYRVRFSLSGNPSGNGGGSPPVKTLAVEVAGTKTDYSVDSTNRSFTAMDWRTETLDFEATSDQTSLAIYSTMPRPDYWGAVIDAVSVVAVR